MLIYLLCFDLGMLFVFKLFVDHPYFRLKYNIFYVLNDLLFNKIGGLLLEKYLLMKLLSKSLKIDSTKLID